MRLEQQDLDTADSHTLERRRRDEREQMRHLREHVGRRLERSLDLALRVAKVERKRRRPRLEALQQPVRVVPVSLLGGHTARRRVRMREQAEALELGELVPHGRR